MTTGCPASLGLAGAVHDCDWTEPHPGHAHHNHQAGATWTGATWRDLAALRAEVVALRDEARQRAWHPKWNAGLSVTTTGQGTSPWAHGENEAYNRVLDLIDKHAREGQ